MEKAFVWEYAKKGILRSEKKERSLGDVWKSSWQNYRLVKVLLNVTDMTGELVEKSL